MESFRKILTNLEEFSSKKDGVQILFIKPSGQGVFKLNFDFLPKKNLILMAAVCNLLVGEVLEVLLGTRMEMLLGVSLGLWIP